MPFAIRVLGLGKSVDTDLVDGLHDNTLPGWWIRSFDPEGNDGIGVVGFTQDRNLAMTFDSVFEAIATYRTVPKSRPFRDDLLPNRPLTAYSVSFEAIP